MIYHAEEKSKEFVKIYPHNPYCTGADDALIRLIPSTHGLNRMERVRWYLNDTNNPSLSITSE